MEIREPSAVHDIWDGIIEGKYVTYSKKHFGQVAGLYKNSKGVNKDTVVYTVYSHDCADKSKKGELYWGLTILEPVYPNGECNMTRGHFHMDRECAEYYFGIAGSGLLLLMDENRNMWAEKVFKGSLHHIDGHWAHRLINTGDVQLKVGACWPVAAGHDYEAIEKMEFPYRVFREKGKIIFERRD